MADTVQINAATSSGAIIATDDVGGVHYQRVKISLGSDGSATDVGIGQKAMAASVPVVVASDQSALPVTDNASSLTVDDGGSSLTVDGSVTVSGSVSIAAVATGGATFSKIRSAASTNATNLKASAGKVVSIFLQNNTTTQQFVKLHNVASTPTAGASVALSFVVNPGDTVTWHGGDQGMAFGTGIGYTITNGQAESDTGNATADGVLGFITWL